MVFVGVAVIVAVAKVVENDGAASGSLRACGGASGTTATGFVWIVTVAGGCGCGCDCGLNGAICRIGSADLLDTAVVAVTFAFAIIGNDDGESTMVFVIFGIGIGLLLLITDDDESVELCWCNVGRDVLAAVIGVIACTRVRPTGTVSKL